MTLKRPIGVSVIPGTFQPHEWDDYMIKLARLRPSAAFIIGHIDRAYEVKSVLADDAHVTYRVYNPYEDQQGSFDNYFHQIHPQPLDVFNRMYDTHHQLFDDFIMCYGINEPGHDDARPGKGLDQLLNWLIEWAYLTHSKGVRSTIGEFATDKTIKAYNRLDVQSGRWNDFIRMCDDLCRDWHDLTMHSYSSYLVLINQIIQAGGDPLNRDFLTYDKWRDIKLSTSQIPYQGGMVMPPYYSTGRELLVTEIQAQLLGVNPIPYGLTEAGLDRKAYLPHYDEATRRFNRNPVQDPLRGYLGHKHYWAWILGKEPEQMTNDEFATMYFRNIASYITSHPNRLRYVTPFTSAMSGEWLTAGFNTNDPSINLYWELASQFNDEFESAMNDPDVPEVPDDPIIIGDDPSNADKRFPPLDDYNWVTGRVAINHDGNFTNVRSTPRALKYDDNVVSRIFEAEKLAKLNLSSDWVVDDDNGSIVWTPIILTEEGVNGWVSGEHISFVRDAIPPIPSDPDDDPTDETPQSCAEYLGQVGLISILLMLVTVMLISSCTVTTPTDEPEVTVEVTDDVTTPTREVWTPIP